LQKQSLRERSLFCFANVQKAVSFVSNISVEKVSNRTRQSYKTLGATLGHTNRNIMNIDTLIFYAGLSTVVIALIVLIYLQIKGNREHEDNITSAQTALRIATQDLTVKRNNLFQSITSIYGQEIADTVDKGNIYNGMPNFLLVLAKGYADNVKESFYKDTRIEKWYYGEYVNRLGNYNYTLEITLENDEVVGSKNLK
jgi:hypothetical protein